MANLCITISRIAVSAWVGAACIFVMTTLQEVHSPQLDSVTKANLAVLRFPVYYTFAFSLVTVALILSICGLRSDTGQRRWFSPTLLLLALLLTGVDYIWIYKPLERMTANVDQARPAEFVDYHRASKWINSGQLSISAVAAISLCWPLSRRNELE